MQNDKSIVQEGLVKQYADKSMDMGVAMDTVQQTSDLEKKKEQLKAAMDNQRMLQAIQQYKAAHTPRVREYKKIGRNDPCPCGATDENGKPIKYKNCCLKTGKFEGYKLMEKK